MNSNLVRGGRHASAGLLSSAPVTFLASDLGTLGVVCYLANAMWYRTRFPALGWVLAVLAWSAASFTWTFIMGRIRRDGGITAFDWIGPALSAILSAGAVWLATRSFTLTQAGAFAALQIAGVTATRLFSGLLARAGEIGRWDGIRFGLAQGVALFAVHPYVRSAILGAGDAMSYSLMVADFREQQHSGIFPILIGQSRFVYNGGFQPIRNAPYFQHLSWLIDILTQGTFNVFALQNLTVLASMLGAVLGCYTALGISAGRGTWLALGLAALYGMCPGILAPLYGGDMYITFMALPFIPWLVLGIEQSSLSPERAWPWAVQGVSLAGMWLAHPPVACWAMIMAVAAALYLGVRDRNWTIIAKAAMVALTVAVLSGYLFVSVSHLDLPLATSRRDSNLIDRKMAVMSQDWRSSLLPVHANAANLLGDIQLGYSLWVCLILAAASAALTRPGRTLLICFGVILMFAWPVPILSKWAWYCLPPQFLLVNGWPAERLYVLLASVAIFVIARTFGGFSRRGVPQELMVAALMIVACFWSASESAKFFRRAVEISHTEAASENEHLVENMTPSRTHSYEYMGTPKYYSDGHMDPILETRLVDAETREAFADGSTAVSGAREPGGKFADFDIIEGVSPVRLPIEPGQALILRFDFLGQNPEGELQITGESFIDVYRLPQSGQKASFGSRGDSGHSLILENTTASSETASFRFFGKTAPRDKIVAHVTCEPLSSRTRAIRITCWTPFHAVVAADRDCYLETPKLFVPGYRAFVDGGSTDVSRSSNGLVQVWLGKGNHDVRIVYIGSRLLRWSYFGSAAAWISVLAMLGAIAARGDLPLETRLIRKIEFLIGPFWTARRTRIAAAVLALLISGTLSVKVGLFSRPAYGDVNMTIMLPAPEFGRSEPLLTTGRTGAGDFIYITYIDGRHISIGHDKWSLGGGVSKPLAVDYQKAQRVEISLGSLYPDGAGPKDLSVKWNGVQVYQENTSAFPSKSGEVTPGENRIGGSTTASRFSGEILKISRQALANPK